MWNSIETGLIRLLLVIDSVVYELVAKLFGLFVELANSRIFTDSIISDFTNRIYILVGVVALFIITYSLIINIVNGDFSKGKIVSYKILGDVVISIILIALIPTIFDYAYKFQEVILEDNIVGKVFLGVSNEKNSITVKNENSGETEEVEIDESYIVKQYGSDLSWAVLNAFFQNNTNENFNVSWAPNAKSKALANGAAEVSFLPCVGAILATGIAAAATGGSGGIAVFAATGGACIGVQVWSAAEDIKYDFNDEETSWNEMTLLARSGDFSQITAFAEEIRGDDNTGGGGKVSYMPIVSTVVGLVLLYMIISYCLDLGLRVVKLAFYEMISPIPILARILPNGKNMFNKWVKVSITVFLEVFIRLTIIFIIVFLASHVYDLDIPGGMLGKAIIIIGIVMFAKQAPKLISDLFGIDSGNMKLGIMDKLNAGTFGLAGGVVGATTGFLGAGIAAKAAGGGFFRGGVSGMANGWKARGNQFGKQKQSMYKSLGGKGKAGLLGKQSWISRVNDKYVKGSMDKVKDKVKEKADTRASTFESGDLFMSEKQNIIANDVGYRNIQDSLASVDSEINAYNVDSINESIANSEKQMGYYRSTQEYKDFVSSKENSDYQLYKDNYYDNKLSVTENRERYQQMVADGRFDRIRDAKFANSGGENAQKFAEHFKAKVQSEQELAAEQSRLKDLQARKSELEVSSGQYLRDNDKNFTEKTRAVFTDDKSKYSDTKDKAVKSYVEDVKLADDMKKYADDKKSSERLLKDLEKLMKDNEKNK